VDKLGTAYNDDIIATGYGSMIATPMIRKAVEDKKAKGGKLTEQDARNLLADCIKVMYYRDCRAGNKVSSQCISGTNYSLSLLIF